MTLRLLAALLALGGAACAPSQPVAPAPASPASPRPAASAPDLDPGDLRLVERAVDGDTLVLAGGERVRIVGIDTPELSHPDERVRALAQEARKQVALWTEGTRLRILVAMDAMPRDQHGRLLAHAEVPGGEPADVAERLLVAGLARPYPSPHPRAERYRALASAARREGRGIWAGPVARVLGLSAEADIECGAAASQVGRRVRVRGRLQPGIRGEGVHRSGLDCGPARLEIIVFPSRYDEIPLDLMERWAASEVAITGEISEHRGRPQVILEDPFQVEILPAP